MQDLPPNVRPSKTGDGYIIDTPEGPQPWPRPDVRSDVPPPSATRFLDLTNDQLQDEPPPCPHLPPECADPRRGYVHRDRSNKPKEPADGV